VPGSPVVAATPRTRLVLAGCSLAYFMVLLDVTVLAVAEPDLIASLHTDVIGVGWATTAYTTALASAVLLGGGLTDRFGPRRVLVLGTVGFGLASLACALAPGIGPLLVGRTGLGLFAATMIPSSLALVTIGHPQPAQRARAIGVWASVSGAAMAAGPVVGGWLVGLGGWRSVFLINAPLAVVVLWLCRGPATTATRRPLTLAPHLGLALTLGLMTLTITQAGQQQWTALLPGAAAVAAGVATAWLDQRARVRLLPASLWASRPIRAAALWATVINYALTTVLFSVPLLLAAEAVVVGLTLLPMTLLIAVNPVLTGRMAARFGALLPIRLGFAAAALGLTAIAAALAGEPRTPLLAAGLVACGLGVSWTLPALTGYAAGHAPPDGAGAVGGLVNAVRHVGATVAAAVAGVLIDAGLPVAPLAGAALLCTAGLVGSLVHRADPG
jgi:Arabinose efflux permease